MPCLITALAQEPLHQNTVALPMSSHPREHEPNVRANSFDFLFIHSFYRPSSPFIDPCCSEIVRALFCSTWNLSCAWSIASIDDRRFRTAAKARNKRPEKSPRSPTQGSKPFEAIPTTAHKAPTTMPNHPVAMSMKLTQFALGF